MQHLKLYTYLVNTFAIARSARVLPNSSWYCFDLSSSAFRLCPRASISTSFNCAPARASPSSASSRFILSAGAQRRQTRHTRHMSKASAGVSAANRSRPRDSKCRKLSLCESEPGDKARTFALLRDVHERVQHPHKVFDLVFEVLWVVILLRCCIHVEVWCRPFL